MSRSIELLPRESLLQTGPVDHADWNYRLPVAIIQRQRFHLILRLFPATRPSRLLELGYGSGVFMPELAKHGDELLGVDVHDQPLAVAERLAAQGVQARLYQASATAMPLADASIDCVVAVSCLEFIDDLDAACRELRRVLTSTGCLVTVTPGVSPVVDWGLRTLTGASPRDDFARRREQVLPTLRRYFEIERSCNCPRVGPTWLRLYRALRLRPPLP